MKNLIIAYCFLFTIQITKGQQQLDALQSDPKSMGWMKGFPPKKDSVISALDGSFFQFPAMRYSVCNMNQFLPTTTVRSANKNRYTFEYAPDKNIDTVTFIPWHHSEKLSWQQSLQQNYTDGVIILHKGKIVYQQYFGALTADGTHALMSISKTLTGTLGALLIAEGLLSENKTAAYYVPELSYSAFADATIGQILDMTTAVQFSETYSDPNAEIWSFSAAGNPFQKSNNYDGPTNYYEYLKTVQKNGNHGEAFGYKTINTDALGWIISRVTGKSIPQLLSERIWQPLGTQYDGYYQIDAAGIAFAGGGFNCSLLDAAMFGEMIRNNGFFNGTQIIPEQVILNIRKGGSQPAFAKAGYTELKNWSYKNMWWNTHNKNGAITARGVHGQTIYVDFEAEMIIVRLASNPVASNTANDPYSLPAYQSIADYLKQKKK